MIDKSYGLAGSVGRSAVSLAVLALIGGPALATEIKFPKDSPKIVMDVPADWAVDVTATGLELKSPDKTSIIVAQVINRKKSLVEAWSKEAAGKMMAFGVSFEKNEHPGGKPKTEAANAPAAVAAPATSPTPPPATSPTPAAAPFNPASPTPPTTAVAANDLLPPIEPPTAPSKVPGFTFSGVPSLEAPPGVTAPTNAVDPHQFTVDPLKEVDVNITKGAKLDFKSVKYYGTTLNGSPVDVELAIYKIADDRLFLFMQESTPTDERSVAIGQSVRLIKK